MSDDRRERYINPYTDFGFKKLFEQAEIARYSDAERRLYEESRKEYWDYNSTLETAERKGEKKGLLKGMQKGIEKGRKEGREEGRKEGRKEGILATALKMKTDGMPVDLIAKYTGLPVEEIMSLVSD